MPKNISRPIVVFSKKFTSIDSAVFEILQDTHEYTVYTQLYNFLNKL